MILKYGRLDVNTGTLTNLTKGGCGGNLTIVTDKTKLKMSNSMKEYWNNINDDKKKDINDKKSIGRKKAWDKLTIDEKNEILKRSIVNEKKILIKLKNA